MNWCQFYNSLLLSPGDDKVVGAFNHLAWTGKLRCYDCAHTGRRRWRGITWAVLRCEKYGKKLKCSMCGKDLGKVLTHAEAYRREVAKGMRALCKRGDRRGQVLQAAC